MGWVKLDDAFHAHPKVMAAGLEATGLFALSLSYSANYLTDGNVPHRWVQMTAGKRAQQLADALVATGLWDPRPNGYQVHDYLEWNMSKAQVLARRERDSTRKTRG